MLPTPSEYSRIQAFFTALILGLLGWRITIALPTVFVFLRADGLAGLSEEMGRMLWIGARFLIDLVFFRVVYHREYRRPALFAAGLWLSASLGFEEFSFGWALLDLRNALIPLAVIIFFILGYIWIFHRLRIRGKILMVCLFSAILPMGLLGFALLQQSEFIQEHALLPVARESLENDALRLNTELNLKVTEGLQRLLGIEPINLYRKRYSIQWTDAKTLFERAQILGIPLMEVRMLESGSASSRVSGNTITTFPPANPALFSGSATPPENLGASKPSSMGANPALSTDTAMSDFDKWSELAWSESEQNSFAYFENNTAARGRLIFFTLDHIQRLFVGFPRRSPSPEPGTTRVTGVTTMVIDYSTWIQHLLVNQTSGNFRDVVIIYSTSEKLLEPILSGVCEFSDRHGSSKFFSTFYPTGGKMKESYQFCITDNNDFIDFSGFFGNVSRPTPAPLGVNSDVRLSSRSGTDWLLQGWTLPRAKTRVTFVFPACAISDILVERQIKPLLFTILAVILAAALSIIYSGSLSKPLVSITDAARRIRDGELDAPLPSHESHDEIRELTETFAVMTERLKGRIDTVNRHLCDEKAKFETLVEATWEGIFLLTPSGLLAYANAAGRRLIGEEKVGSCFFEALGASGNEFQPPLPPALDRCCLSEYRTFFQIPDRDGGKGRIIALYLRTLTTSSPELGFIAVCRDVTTEKEIDRMKSEFVSQVSHELRTPLTSIQAYTEMLLDDEVDDPMSRREYLEIILDESQRLARLINDLLDLARIESGKRAIKPVRLDLVEVSRGLLTVLKGQADRRGVKVDFLLPEEPVYFTGDADLIKQMGLNILSNGLKYTHTGGRVIISLTRPGPGRIAWSFSDTGIGLTKDERDRLFTKFFRADSEFVKAAGGTGLGLPLVKQIVDRHGGEIVVESVYGKGSTFTVFLTSPTKE
ncbi:MAG: histidine kinase dimerization/phospho-acceptor domain-containing protein [Candidatus Ozemobacteraceae bacterium]